MTPERLFRVEEANAIVPRLHILLERLQRGALRLHEQAAALAAERGEPAGTLSMEALLRHCPQTRHLVEELDAVVREIQESGALLKDARVGLVDFPAERKGEIVYLCWQYGEPEVAYWHRVGDGFGGRQPLPGKPRARTLQ